ncbi:MAG: hypothetical protein SGBAC_009541 [Bacillariaceae sp.]
MLENCWTNPNEPREGSRRSARKRRISKVSEEPTVIRHRLLLEPTLARRRARQRRREQEENAARSEGQSKLDKRPESVARKDALRRKLGPHGHNTPLSASNETTNSTTPDSFPSRKFAASSQSSAAAAPDTITSSSRDSSLNALAPPRTGTTKEGPSNRAPTPPLVPAAKISNSTITPPQCNAVPSIPVPSPAAVTASPSGLPMNHNEVQVLGVARPQYTDIVPGIPIHNPAAAIVSPIGIPTYNAEIRDLMSWNRRQMLDDSHTLETLRKRERAVLLMQRSTDVSSVIASSRLVREFYVGSLLDPSTQVLLENAEGRGMLWLAKLLTGSFSKPMVLGGLGFPLDNAKLIAEEIVVNLGDMIGKIAITYDALVGIHILPHDAMLIAPTLRVIASAIKEKSLAFRQDIILKAETSFGLQMMPTATYPSISLGAYGY